MFKFKNIKNTKNIKALKQRLSKKNLLENALQKLNRNMNLRHFSTASDEDPTFNYGKKREKSAIKVDSGNTSASVYNATQQGASASGSFVKMGHKDNYGETGIEHFRIKSTPLGTRIDPYYLTRSFNWRNFKGVLEGSPLGVSGSLLSLLFGPFTPYGKATLGYQGQDRRVDLSTGWPFVNVTPTATASSTSPVSTESSEEMASQPESKQPFALEEDLANVELQKIKEMYESQSGYDPLAREYRY